MTATRPRAALVARLLREGVISLGPVADAFAAEPRERFIPSVHSEHGLAAVYRDEAFVTKRDARGMPLSSSSQPALMARMLELLDVHPGHRVLEIGAGTGYNAALLARLVGPRGHVTTVDIDAGVASQARRALRASGHRVTVAVGDGREGYATRAPYDRIIVTACSDGLHRAWLEQLAGGGLLEVPLRLDPDRSAIQVIPVFERQGDRLRSAGLTWGGFMPLHGGDGGWRPPPATMTVTRSGRGRHTSLVSIAGGAVSHLSESAARRLLALALTDAQASRARGTIAMSGAHPPLLLIYLLLNIPDSRRVAVHSHGRMGIGLIDRRTGSLGVVSVRSPWIGQADSHNPRARWRLDAYGGDEAAAELMRLLADWQAIQRRGERRLQITAGGPARVLELRFRWVR
jgi:protein-L-isoaspartate(D-aspartate) O-methyltransferase